MESIGRLAGGIAHDFNNLLTVINGFCEILMRRTPPDAPGRKELTQVLAAGERAADLAGQLLAFSRRRQTAAGTLNLNQVVEECVAMLRRLVGDHIVIVTRLDPALASIKGDSGQILQVLMNLAANSRDAMPGGGTLTIATANVAAGAVRQLSGAGTWQSPPPEGPLVSLVVTDTGAGMAPEVKQHAFDPFFTTKAGVGTGLGLFTVAGIVQRHGGAISVRSASQFAGEPGAAGGTAFEILFPRLTVPAAAGGPEPSASARRREPQPSGGETILVVDDRADVRELVGIELRECGYTVIKASSGPEALQAASDHAGAIDLLLTDLLMPGMSGPDLAARLRASCSGLAVLYMSGNPDAHASLVEGDGVHWIQKPFRWDDLARKVRQVLDA
jgi:CheY-like chemotaxis protein